MRKLGTTLAVMGGILLSHPLLGAWPGGNVVNETVHNLSHTAKVDPMSGFIADYGEACVYCHTSHGGDESDLLWNRSVPTGPYRMYESDTMDMITDPQPTELSLFCLSCHDGTQGLDEIINVPTTSPMISSIGEPIETCATDCHTGGSPDGGLNWENVWFEDDLRKQHPISILYDPSRDPNFNSVAAVEAAGVRLYDGKIQCASCHSPHSQQFPPFLRINNAGGSMCFACHTNNPGESTAHFW